MMYLKFNLKKITLMTGFVVQGHKYIPFLSFSYIVILHFTACLFKQDCTDTNRKN